MARKPLSDIVQELRDAEIERRGYAVPDSYQGVSLEKISVVLARIDRTTENEVRAVFALLDDEHSNWHSKAPAGALFCHGASTAHIGSHVAILQQGLTIKLDREGRDYWIKPLRDVGAIEAVYPFGNDFLLGHPVPKSPLSSYRLEESFVRILKAPDGEWEDLLVSWFEGDHIRERLKFQAEMAEKTAKLVVTKHADLIASSIENYVPRFLPDYEILFTDANDGDRITPGEKELMDQAGIVLQADDAMPDVLLWNREINSIWIIEAVTSDGEVDYRKIEQTLKMAARSGKALSGFTTTYQTWSAASSRQKKHKNIAPNTYIWIEEDPTKHFLAEPFGAIPTLISVED